VTARLINHNPNAYGKRTFSEDLDFNKQKSICEELIECADIIHLHHFINPVKNVFGINFSHKKILRHFHSEPKFLARHAGVTVDTILSDPLPSVVVAQFHERLYPSARPVPNLLARQPSVLAAESNRFAHRDVPVICFSPTTAAPGLTERWNTKGAPETLKVLTELGKFTNFHADVFIGLPHHLALQRKRDADIILDEMVTGSYHLSGLEGLSLGKPTFGYLDQRVVSVLCSLTGCNSLPWVNVHLSRLPEVLKLFVESSELREIAGHASKMWVERYWNEQNLVSSYVAVYDDVLAGATRLRHAPVDVLYDVAMPDYHWRQNIKELRAVLREN